MFATGKIPPATCPKGKQNIQFQKKLICSTACNTCTWFDVAVRLSAIF